MALYDCSEIDARTFMQVIDYQAATAPDKIWILTDDARITFSQARSIILSRARMFREAGLGAGQTAALMMPPSANTVLYGLGAIVAGGICAVIDTEISGEFLTNRITETQARILVAQECFREKLAGCTGSTDRVIFCSATDTSADTDPLPTGPTDEKADPLSPALVWWTSGTTGKPKGVLHSQSSALFQAWNAARMQQPDEVYYCCTPMYLGGAWFTAVLPTLIAGTTIAIDSTFSVSHYWDRIRHFKATSSLLLGAMHEYILNAPEHPDDADNPLRTAYCIPITHQSALRFQERFDVAATPQMYGMSETGMILKMPEGIGWDDGAIGLPVGHYETMIVDEQGNPVQQGQVGELWVRPRQPGIMFLGYFNDPQATLNVMRDQWYHCGDTVYCGDDGLLRFHGRKKDYIRHKGRNVALYQVDTIVQNHPHVLEAASFGVPADDAETEEEIALAVVGQAGAKISESDLLDFISENGPYYLVPRYVIISDRLPLNKHGRVMKHELRRMFDRDMAWDSHQHGFDGRRHIRSAG